MVKIKVASMLMQILKSEYRCSEIYALVCVRVHLGNPIEYIILGVELWDNCTHTCV